MQLSIIILNYKSKELVKYFLKRIRGFKFDFEWEVIVIDNDSRDGLGEMMEKDFSDIQFIQSDKNIGMGAGNNVGIKKSRGEYVLIANPDIFLNETAIKEMIEFMDRNKEAGIIGPRLSNPDGGKQDSCYRFPSFFTFLYRRTLFGRTRKGLEHLKYFTYHDSDLANSLKVDWVLGGCFMTRKSAIDKAGIFDEDFFLFLEDTDLCRRMWDKEFEVWYHPQAEVVHLPHRLSAGEGRIRDIFSKLTWAHLASWARYFWKWKRDN